jgi:hypothetical protein
MSSEDPSADINDVFVFINPLDPTRVVFAMTVIGTDVLCQFKIDNTGDAREDLVIQATFDGHESLRDPRCPAPGGGQFVTVAGPARPTHTGADNDLLRRGPELSGCTNTVLTAGGIRVWAGLPKIRSWSTSDRSTRRRRPGGVPGVDEPGAGAAAGPDRSG